MRILPFSGLKPFVFILVCVISMSKDSKAQADEIIGVKAKYAWDNILKGYTDPNTGEVTRPSLNKRDRGYFNEIEKEWENLGPNKLPSEMNPGGKAIPTYSIGRGNGTGRINHILVNPDEEDNVFACSPTGGLFVTWDGGKTWESAGTDKLPITGVASVTINPRDPHNWIIGTGDSDDKFMFSDGIWRTFDAGKNWVNINGRKSSIPISEETAQWTFIGDVKAHPCDFNRVFVASNKGLFMTGNALEEDPLKVEWTKVAEGQFYDVEVVPWAESLVFAGGDRFVWSRNCGNDWDDLPMPQYESKDRYKFARLQIELTEKDPDNLYVAVTNAEKHGMSSVGEASFQKFNYRTGEWEYIRSLKKGMNNIIPTRARAFTVDPRDSALVLAANVQPIYRSVDGGRNFERIERGQMHDDVHDITFSPDSGRVWAAHDGGVSVSYDRGITWQPRDNGIGAANVFGISVAQTTETQVLYGAYDTGGNLLKDGEWYHVTWG
ncbi:MAG: hypothetical protein HKN32_09145, partial [Flavobacteriales bacterium]|nr:hypothetical protein [Flavobacteriales bacterium]